MNKRLRENDMNRKKRQAVTERSELEQMAEKLPENERDRLIQELRNYSRHHYVEERGVKQLELLKQELQDEIDAFDEDELTSLERKNLERKKV